MRLGCRQVVLLGILMAGCAGHAASTDRPREVGASELARQPVKTAGSTMDRAFADYDASRYAEAETSFRLLASTGAPRGRLGLALVLLATGRYSAAETTASDVVGAPPALALDLVRVRGEALRRQ